MKHFSLIILLSFLISISIFAQNDIGNKTDNDINVIPKIENNNAVNDKIEFKNSPTTSILTITDEGNNASSLTLPDVTSPLSGNKLYNNGGNLFWGANQLGTTGSAGGWVHNGNYIYTSTLTDYVGIGTATPSVNLDILSSGVDDGGVLHLGNLDKSHMLGFFSGRENDPNPFLAWIDSDALRFATISKYNLTGFTERMRINGNGNVGIGTINPMSLLSVGGDGFAEVAIYGETSLENGIGVHSAATNTGNFTNYGALFIAAGSTGRGVYATASNTGNFANFGGYFTAYGSSGRGVSGYAGNSGDVTNFGGHFEASGTYGTGVFGFADNSGNGTNYGGYFAANGINGRGVFGYAQSSGYAGYFDGHLHATGAITGASKSFKIDHPLDPENKYLLHTSVESPDMMNIYNGNATTNADGDAIVVLPDWFEVLNQDFRYQLTVIGEFAQAIVSEKINNNQFSIKTNKPNIEVSWQVTGIRHDAWANDNRTVVEQNKSDNERGKYLHPEAFNLPETASIDYDEKMEEERIRIIEESSHLENKE